VNAGEATFIGRTATAAMRRSLPRAAPSWRWRTHTGPTR